MRKRKYSSRLLFFLLGAVLLMSQAAMASQDSVLDRISAAVTPFNMQIDSVHELPLKIVIANETYQGGSFKVLARKDSISRFRCSVCHTDKNVQVNEAAFYTHGDVKINHGKGENKLTCIDCHHEKDRDSLVDKQGRKIDFDHSYQLCGQCHFRPKRDWVGGAHGKRVTYWTGERVVKNCTSCHNPHSPAFIAKMPETYSLPLD